MLHKYFYTIEVKFHDGIKHKQHVRRLLRLVLRTMKYRVEEDYGFKGIPIKVKIKEVKKLTDL